jgi:hypothetical protein
MNTFVTQDFSPAEVAMMREQADSGIDLFPERDIPAEDTTDAVVQRFLDTHPHARIHPTESVKGAPLIIDESRRNMSGVVGCTGTAYPVYRDVYDTVPAGYDFHAVHTDTQQPRPEVPSV